jgi:hypothetical protein
MQLYSKTVKVANMQWPKVGVKGIIQESLVDGEVDRGVHLRTSGDRASLHLRGALGWRLLLSGIRKGRLSGGFMRI